MDHRYTARTTWTGAGAEGTRRYDGYGRDARIAFDGKPAIEASADAAFRGDAARHNPEDLFVAAVSMCHMLTYLALCAKRGLQVLAYDDEAEGTLALQRDGGGEFASITLRPSVTLAPGSDRALALALHDRAGELCFIARSCRAPIHHQPSVREA